MGNKTQTKKMKISECRPILEDMEADRLINSGVCDGEDGRVGGWVMFTPRTYRPPTHPPHYTHQS